MKTILLLIALIFSSQLIAQTKVPVTMIQEGITLVKAPGVSKPKTCYYAFGGASATLASPTECTSGTCVEVYDSCGAISPPSRSSAGTYIDLTIANGTFANSSYLDCGCKSFDSLGSTLSACDPIFVSPDQTWQTNSSGGAVLNFVSLNSTDVSNDSFIQIKCEGAAP